MKYLIKKYQVIYSTGARDKVTLDMPVLTNDIHSFRAKLMMRLSSPGVEVKGMNLEYDEINTE